MEKQEQKQNQEPLEDRLYKYAELLNRQFEEAKERADYRREKPYRFEREQLIHSNHMEAVRFSARCRFYEYFPEIKREAYKR